MKSMPTNSIDLLLTDPPFGMKGEEPIDEVIERLSEADRVCKRMAIIMDWRNFWRIDSMFHEKKIGELIWEYGWVSGGRTKAKSGFFPTHNTIGLYGNKKDFCFIAGSIIKRRPGFSSPRQCSYAHKTGHPYEKPVLLFEYLLEGSSKPGETVLDPFMGSGTTGVACANLERNFVGIEINPNYYAISKERMEVTE